MQGDTPDVLVVGGGNAALCAAITARQRGASVLVMECATPDYRAGNSRHTRNIRISHGSPQAFLPGAYQEDEFLDDLLRVTGGVTDETLARHTIRMSEALPGWMADCGVHFQPPLTGTLNLSRTNLFFFGGGKTLMNRYYAYAASLGVRFRYDCHVTGIEISDVDVGAVRYTDGSGEAIMRPRTVVAASGGFQANIKWLEQYWGEAARNFLIRGTPNAQGNILRNLLDQGVVSAGDPSQFHAVAIDARSPRFDGGIVTRLDCIPSGIVVNESACRFYDEGEDLWPKRYALWGRLVAQQLGQRAFVVFDDKVARGFMPSAYPAHEAQSISELASLVGLDAASLESTVKGFNAACGPGPVDPKQLDGQGTTGLSPPKSNWAQPVDTPPYRAYPLSPGITFTYLGVRVNERAQVISEQAGPMKSVFAAGEIMAGNILGQGYLAGFGMTIGSVFGRIAGAEAADACR